MDDFQSNPFFITNHDQVPQEVYTIFTTKAICCQVSTYSKSCNSDPTENLPVASEPVSSTRPEYETIPLKLSLLNLPSVIDIRSLKEEIFIIVKRLLIDLAEKMSSLRITNFEENILGGRKNSRLLLSQHQKNKLRKLTTQNLDIYYVVTVLTDPNVESFKPFVVKWMQDSYDLILEKIREYTTREYFGYDLSLNWCTTSEKSNGQFTMCNSDEIVPTKLRIKDVGESFNIEELASGLIGTYKNILAGINGLKVTRIEVADIVRDTKSGYIDIFFNIHVVQNSGQDFTPVIHEVIEKEKDVILGYIQSYSDNNMTGLSWCQNDDVITTSCESGKSLWVIILATGLGMVPFCIINYYIVRCIRKKSDEENEDAVQSYLNGNVVNNNLDQHKRKVNRPQGPSTSSQSSDLPPEQSHFKKSKNEPDDEKRRHQQQRRLASNPHSSRRRSTKTSSSTSSKEILELCLQLDEGVSKQEAGKNEPDDEKRRHQQQRRRTSNPHSSRRRSTKTSSSTSSKEILELCLRLDEGVSRRKSDPDGEHVKELVPYEI